MTEPLNITIDRLSEEYDALRRRCEQVKEPDCKDIELLLEAIKELNKIGLNIQPPEYCTPKQPSSTELKTPTAIIVEKTPTVYRIHGVQYRGKKRIVDITRELLDGGKTKTQQMWMKEYNNGFYGEIGIPDTEIYLNIAITLDDNKEHPNAEQQTLIHEIRGVLSTDFSKNWMMTSTRKERDNIIHQHSTLHAMTRRLRFQSESGQLTRLPNADTIVKILGGDTTAERLDCAMYNLTANRTHLLFRYNCAGVLVFGTDYRFDKGYDVFSIKSIDFGSISSRGVAIRDL